MSARSTGFAVKVQLRTVSTCLDIATKSLDVISDTSNTSSYLLPMSLTVKSLIQLTDNIKRNKTECVSLLEQTYGVLSGIISLHLKMEELTSDHLNHFWDFLRTLHKIHAFVEEQQEGNKIMKFFQQGQINVLLKECRTGLEHAINIFKVRNIDIFQKIDELEKLSKRRHQEVLEFIASFSDNASLDASSLSGSVPSGLYNSSSSFSMLPAEPKIFHGRELEVAAILGLLNQPSPKIAILGPGGMGKTTLARVVLHHSDIVLKYGNNRFFVACDSASTKRELVTLIGLYLGLETGISERDLIQYFSALPDSLLILDNLETAWEAYASREDIEDFLALLASSQLLTLMITMRGTERPAKIAWTRPFLQPLQPLHQDAALATFLEITDDMHKTDDIAQLLALTDYMPLAISLLAHLADSEGVSAVLAHWEDEKTSLVSGGYDKRSNLDLSIAFSLASPRLNNVPGAKDLLSLLSLLPDGLSDMDMLQSKIPIKDILGCRAALLRTSLAFTSQQRVKVLVPIWEYVQVHHPPLLSITEALFHTYRSVLEHFFSSERAGSSHSMMISTNFANMQKIIFFRLQNVPTDVKATIYAALHLNNFSQFIDQQDIPLMAHVPSALVQPPDPRLEVCWAMDQIYTTKPMGLHELESIIAQALQYFPFFDDSHVKCRFYRCVASRYGFNCDSTTAMIWYRKALQMAISAGDFREQSVALERLSYAKRTLGDHVTALVHASEAHQLAMLSGSFIEEAAALRSKSLCLRWLGRYSESLVEHQKAQKLYTLSGMSTRLLSLTIDLAELHNIKSEYIQAQEIIASLVAGSKDSIFMSPIALVTLAELGVETGSSVQDVEDHNEGARQRFKQTGIESYLVYCDMVQGALNLREGNILAAKVALEQCLRCSVGRDSKAMTYCLGKLADITLWSSSYFTPTWPIILLAHAFQSKLKLQVYKGFQFLGTLAFSRGDQGTATSLLTLALDAFTQMDVHRSRAECMFELGNIAHGDGDYQKAEGLWKMAQPLFKRSSQGKKLLLLDRKLAAIKET